MDSAFSSKDCHSLICVHLFQVIIIIFTFGICNNLIRWYYSPTKVGQVDKKQTCMAWWREFDFSRRCENFIVMDNLYFCKRSLTLERPILTLISSRRNSLKFFLIKTNWMIVWREKKYIWYYVILWLHQGSKGWRGVFGVGFGIWSSDMWCHGDVVGGEGESIVEAVEVWVC